MSIDYTPFNRDQFADLVIWHTTDAVLAEHAANAAIDADTDDAVEFQIAMTELYALRAQIFTADNVAAIARSSGHIERQTRDALWIDPQLLIGTWPLDRAGAALTAWKAHL